MAELAMVHTGLLTAEARTGIRSLLEEAFDALDEQDWEHCLGGLHAVAREGDDVVGHAALVQRRLLHGGRAWRAGYVEGVAVRADRRRHGIGGRLMEALEDVGRRAYDVLALSTTEQADAFYAARGWQPWSGPTSVLAPTGVLRTPDDDDAVRVLPLSVELDLHGELICDWRDGDVW